MMRAGQSVYGRAALVIVISLAWSWSAAAQQLLFHFPLDGSPVASGVTGAIARLYMLDAGAPPATVPGKYGSALHFNGNAAIAMPFKLDSVAYPNVTVTAWVKVDGGSKGERTVFSAGNGNVPRLSVHGDRASFTAARGSLLFTAAMPPDQWVFVAGVVDLGNARLATYQDAGQVLKEGISVSNLYPPSNYRNPDDSALASMPYVFVGSHGFNQWRANQMAIDDVRVYAGALTPDQIAAIRSGAGASSSGPAAPSQGDDVVGTGGAIGGDYVAGGNLVGTGGATGGDDGSGASRPTFQGGVLTQKNIDDLAKARAERTGPVITYSSEQEALAAEERRKREAAEVELARQQNELEAAGRAAESGGIDRADSEGTAARVIGWRLSASDFKQSPTSGANGDIIRVVDLGDEPLTGLKIFEPNNVPCIVDLYGSDPAHRAGHFFECTPGIGIVDLSILNEAMITPAAIESLQVCSSFMSNDRVKGIAVSGHIIGPDGTPGFYQQAKGDGPNCARWESIVTCPGGYVASGAVAHFKDRDLSESLVGLGLICRKIERIYQ